MANPSKRKGTAAETAVVDYLRERGFPEVERRAQAGTKDRGDIAGIPGVVIEVKAERQIDLAGWLKEAHAEAVNDGPLSLGVVWRKAPGTTDAGRWHVLMDGATFTYFLRRATRR